MTILLLDTNDTESHYLAYLLYDLISSDSSSKTDNRHNHTILYSLLHWSVQKIFKNCYKNIQEINNRLLGFGEDRIPYEKRIHLMKTSDYVKSKALDKLKEINKVQRILYKKSSLLNRDLVKSLINKIRMLQKQKVFLQKKLRESVRDQAYWI